MSKMIQVRNVPDDVHAELKARAARERMTLSDFLLREATRVTQRIAPEELIQRASARRVSPEAPSAAKLVRAQRGEPHARTTSASTADPPRR